MKRPLMPGLILMAVAASAEPPSAETRLQGQSAPPSATQPVLGDAAAALDAESARRLAGLARTSVDYQLASRATGSLGFLCGIQPGATPFGAAAVRGTDVNGRFLGARLKLSFR